VKLKELSLDNNCIRQIEGAAHWPLLRRLSLADNLISSVNDCGLDSPTHLQYLSLENNCITSMAGFQQISALSELYLSGNLVTNARSIFSLKVECCAYCYNTRSHPEMVGDISRVALNFDLSKIPFVLF